MINACQIVKGSSINKDSPYAERQLTLSEIDSMYQNKLISIEKARSLATKIAIRSKKHKIDMLKAIY